MGKFSAFLAAAAFVVLSIAAWVTHVVVCIKTAAWALLAIGAFIAPIGVIHGVGIWLGWFS